MVGLDMPFNADSIAARLLASARFSACEKAAIFFIQLRSAPAQKLFPRPSSTSTRMPVSASKVRTTCVSSAIRVWSNALCTSGRLSATRAIAPATVTSSVEYVAVGSVMALHPEHAEPGRLDRFVQRRRDREPEHLAGVRGIDHTVIPQACAGVVRMAFAFVLLADRRLERGLFVGAPRGSLGFQGATADCRQHSRRLFASHDRDARIGPHPEKARIERPAAHAIVAGAVAAADDHGEFGHLGAGHGGDELRAILGDAARLVLLPDHEAGDVLEKDQRYVALTAELDEVRAFERGFREQHAVVGDDTHGITPQPREAGDQGRAVAGLEFLEVAAVDEARDDLAHVVGLLDVRVDDAVDLLGPKQR